MPMKNEHAVRVHDPKRYIRMRRRSDAFGKGVDAIFGVLKKAINGTKVEVQALRFDASKFTLSAVKKWVEAHGGKGMGLKIEPAYDHGHVGEVYRGNPMNAKGVSAWLEAAYHEEKKGIQEYEKLLHYIKGAPEYSHERTIVKKILRDERRHLRMLEKYVAR